MFFILTHDLEFLVNVSNIYQPCLSLKKKKKKSAMQQNVVDVVIGVAVIFQADGF